MAGGMALVLTELDAGQIPGIWRLALLLLCSDDNRTVLQITSDSHEARSTIPRPQAALPCSLPVNKSGLQITYWYIITP